MNTILRHLVAAIPIVLMAHSAFSQDINTILMESTCKIVGPGSMGTGFIIGKPATNEPPRAYYTLITANHVLDAVQGESVNVVIREFLGSNMWKRAEIPVRIRIGTKPLWKKHPEVDVAGIFVGLPTNTVRNILATDLLVDDATLTKYGLHPGTELMCLGYPFGAEANSFGFPILRSGRIASYPITPTHQTKTFLFDFTVFRGNSGGPVYFVEHDPTVDGGRQIGLTVQGIIGLVVQERNITESIQELYEKREKVTPLQLGEVIHAVFIKELVESMGFPEK